MDLWKMLMLASHLPADDIIHENSGCLSNFRWWTWFEHWWTDWWKIYIRNWNRKIFVNKSCSEKTKCWDTKGLKVINHWLTGYIYTVCDINAWPLDQDQCFKAQYNISATVLYSNTYSSNNQDHYLFINSWCRKEKTHK